MESIVKSLKKSFVTLSEAEQNTVLRSFADLRNEDLTRSYVKLSFAPRFNSQTRPIYAGTCVCGHDSKRHWFLNNDFKDCKSCNCEGFME